MVDDASTDDTPAVVKAKAAQYPGRVVHLRREQGGQGKAHTLNHGLGVILGDDWMQALLITDADVIFEPAALRTMTRHLADPRVGAVTCYIKEGSRPGNYLTRFIGYEYVTAQAAARRGQNVLGALACLAGGAQLHARTSLVALGGQIDTSSLAEDTITTFETQLRGRRVVFEPHATCWAEEPDDRRRTCGSSGCAGRAATCRSPSGTAGSGSGRAAGSASAGLPSACCGSASSCSRSS